LSSTLPPAPEIFFGRDDFVDNAVSLLQTVGPARLTILGAGGIGKTATALTILHHEKVQHRFLGHRHFVSCEAATSPQMLIISILQMLDVKLASGWDGLTTLHKFLMSSAPKLIVLDNFETPWEGSGVQSDVAEILFQIAAVKHVSLIVTMRGNTNPSGIQWTWSAKKSILPPLAPEAAKSVFLAINPLQEEHLDQQNDLALLLHNTNYVPLAIHLIAQLGTGQSYHQLLENWTSAKATLLQTQGCTTQRLTSLDVSIEMLLKSSPMEEEPEAIQLLAVICYLPNGLHNWQEKLNCVMTGFQNVHHALHVLLKSALVFIEMNTLMALSPVRCYMISRYPAQMQHIERLEKYYFDLVGECHTAPHGSALVNAIPIWQPEMGNITQTLKLALKRQATKELVDICYKLSSYMYKTYGSTDLIHDAVPYLDILDMSEIRPKFTQLFGYILQQQCKYEEAAEKLNQAWQQFLQIGDALGTAQCLQGLGEILQMQAKYEEATEKLGQAQQQFIELGDLIGAAQCLQTLREMQKKATEKLLGSQHPDSLANLISTYQEQGMWKEAEKLEVQVMEICKQMLGEEHPDTLSAMAKLAVAYGNQGQWKEAEELQVVVMERRRKVLGTEHPDSLSAMANLAMTYGIQGQWKEAEELLVVVMERRKKVLGTEHPDTLSTMASLASAYQKQGQWKEAEELQAVVMKTRNQVLGIKHPDTLSAMANLATMYCNHSQWKKAEEVQVVIMDIRKQMLGTEHPDTLSAMTDLASIHQMLLPPLTPHINMTVAQLALDHVTTHMDGIKNTLEHIGSGNSNGAFYVQTGFNEDILFLGQGILQEIYIYINFDLSDDKIVLDQLGKQLSPFPGILFTPTTSYAIPLVSSEGYSLDETEIWNLWEANQVFVQGLCSSHNIPSQETAAQAISKADTEGQKVDDTDGSSRCDNKQTERLPGGKGPGNCCGHKEESSDSDNDADTSGDPDSSCGGRHGSYNDINPRSGSNGGAELGIGSGSGADWNGDSNMSGGGSEHGPYENDQGHGIFSIPFTSSLEVEWDENPQLSQTFTTTGTVNLTVRVSQLLLHFLLIEHNFF
jgi:tetratricopeptide (TPR) repeat protein